MQDTKERLSPLWIFALLNYLYVLALLLSLPAEFSPTSPTMGPAGFSGVDGNTPSP